jgi:hypothetical protein
MRGGKGTSNRELWIAQALIVLCAIAAFARGIPNALVLSWDDGAFIVNNPDVHQVSWASLTRVFTSIREQSFHPLQWLSYWVDVPWLGAQPSVLHAVNLAWWCLDLLLLWRAMQALGLDVRAATLATLLFGLHPVQIEVVSWATGRKDIVALMFVCIALLLHARGTTRSRWGASAAYLCACLSKTVSIPLPLMLMLADLLLQRTPMRAAVLRQLPNLLVAVTLGGVVVWIWSSHELIRVDMAGSEVMSLPIRVSATLSHYLATFIWPAKLSPLYPQLREARLEAWMLAGPAILGAGLIYAWSARDREIGFSLLAFVALFLPVSNLIPLYLQWQDRYLCTPMLALSYGAGVMFERAERRVRPLWVLRSAALVCALALMTRSAQYVEAWSSERRLWEHATATQPGAFLAWIKLGEVRRNERHFDGSIAAYDRALALVPTSRLASSARFFALGLRDEARERIGGRSRAHELSKQYYLTADDPTRLRQWTDELIRLNYRGLVMAVFDRSLELDPVSRERLLAAARSHHKQGNPWLARYFEAKAQALGEQKQASES